MNYKVRELTIWERSALIDALTQAQENPVLSALELISRAVEIEGRELDKKFIAGRQIKMLKDEDLEELLSFLTSEEIGRIVQEILEKNKIPFLKTNG